MKQWFYRVMIAEIAVGGDSQTGWRGKGMELVELRADLADGRIFLSAGRAQQRLNRLGWQAARCEGRRRHVLNLVGGDRRLSASVAR